jgi:hypothetical protein
MACLCWAMVYWRFLGVKRNTGFVSTGIKHNAKGITAVMRSRGSKIGHQWIYGHKIPMLLLRTMHIYHFHSASFKEIEKKKKLAWANSQFLYTLIQSPTKPPFSPSTSPCHAPPTSSSLPHPSPSAPRPPSPLSSPRNASPHPPSPTYSVPPPAS